MRVTNSMLIFNMMSNHNKNLKNMSRLQQQLTTGRRILMPSDDPVATAKSMKLRTDLVRNERYVSNAENAVSWLEVTESALKDLGDVLHRVKELTVEGSNDSLSTEEREKIADEIDQLKEHVIQVGNSTYAGRYIFAGYKTDKPPFEDTAGVVNYVGDNGKIEYEVSTGIRIDVNVNGGDGGAEIDKICGVMQDLSDTLRTGSTEEISSFLTKIDKRLTQVLAQRSAVGAKTNRFELIKQRHLDEGTNFASLLSLTEDVDIAQAIMKLKEAENVYRSSLATGARIIMPSLVDFLR